MIDPEAAYQALASRDPRFDGIFFVGVTSTGIYCRPICPAKTPRRAGCRFFAGAGAAEKAGFRPCLRCRPELAPGQAPVDRGRRLVHLVMQRMDERGLGDGPGLEEIMDGLGVGARQFRRIVQQELGVSPIELLQTRRLLLAKQLLTETRLPVTEVAFASGFSSLRRFNAAFRSRYRMPPTRLRREGARGEGPTGDTATILLSYRPPYDWDGLLGFLGARSMKGVEIVGAKSYSRTVSLGGCRGGIRVTHAPEKRAVRVEFTRSLTPALPALIGRLQHVFDLTARPDQIAGLLRKDRRLAASVRKNPGLRVPGAFDGFEAAVRAILGQQVSVRAATTIAARFAGEFGEKLAAPFDGLTTLSPTARSVVRATVDRIASLGIIHARAAAILALARGVESGALRLEPGGPAQETIEGLKKIPGLGPWTAEYIALRALHWPDAFPKEDLAVRARLGGVSAREAGQIAQAWRPWRSYAVMHLWRGTASPIGPSGNREKIGRPPA